MRVCTVGLHQDHHGGRVGRREHWISTHSFTWRKQGNEELSYLPHGLALALSLGSHFRWQHACHWKFQHGGWWWHLCLFGHLGLLMAADVCWSMQNFGLYYLSFFKIYLYSNSHSMNKIALTILTGSKAKEWPNSHITHLSIPGVMNTSHFNQ